MFSSDVEKADIHRGDAEEQRRTEIEELGRGSLVLKALKQTHAASADEPAMQSVAEAVHMEQRQRQQKTIGARDLPARQKIERVRGEVVVREDGALGDAGGAGCINDAGGRIAVESDLRPAVRKRSRFAREIHGTPNRRGAREGRGGDHGRGLGVRKDVHELALAIQDVDRDEDHAKLDAGEIEVDHFEAIRKVDAKAITCFEAAKRKQLGQAIAAGVDVAEGICGALEFEGDVIAPGVEREIEELSEIQKLKVTCVACDGAGAGLTRFALKVISYWSTKEIDVRIKKRLALAAVAALAFALPLVAHHAVSAEFDSGKVITLKGVVSKVDWVNPHIFIYFDVKDENGKVTTWRLQSSPPMFFKGSGLTKEKLVDGSEATVTAFPAKDGTDAFGFLLKLVYPDGRFYNLGGANAPAPPNPAK